MEHLGAIAVADLQRALDRTDDAVAAQRLVAAIAYKHGVSQTELAAWFDVERKTIYNWLNRLEERDLERAVADRTRPGRPRKLDADERRELESLLRQSPGALGYDAPGWTVDLVQRLVAERFETDYSSSSIRRLLGEFGLEPLTLRQAVDREVLDVDLSAQELSDVGYVWVRD